MSRHEVCAQSGGNHYRPEPESKKPAGVRAWGTAIRLLCVPSSGNRPVRVFAVSERAACDRCSVARTGVAGSIAIAHIRYNLSRSKRCMRLLAMSVFSSMRTRSSWAKRAASSLCQYSERVLPPRQAGQVLRTVP